MPTRRLWSRSSRATPAIFILAFDGFSRVLRLVMSLGGVADRRQGGRGGGFAKAKVCRRSCQEGKIRKVVIAARLLKNWLREPSFCLAAPQSSSAMSQTV